MVSKEDVVKKLREVYDPEIFINVYDLGLIYDIKIKKGSEGDIVKILMTLTFVGCPLAGLITKMVEEKIKEINGVQDVIVELTFEPPWNRSMIRDAEIRKRFGLEPTTFRTNEQ